MKKLFLLLSLFAVVCLDSVAQSVTINSTKRNVVERGRRWDSNYNCNVPAFAHDYILDLNIAGMQGQEVDVIIYFEQPKGVPLKDTNGKYRTTDGNVSASTTVTPRYDNSHWDRLVVSIPEHELEGVDFRKPFFCDIRVSGDGFFSKEHYVQIGKSGSDDSPMPYVPQDEICYQCGNTGKCSNCGGRGYVYNPVGKGSYATCCLCNGSGRCSSCR